MCKICIARRLVVDISRDSMRILCLSLAGRWWRAECETGQLTPEQAAHMVNAITPLYSGQSAYGAS